MINYNQQFKNKKTNLRNLKATDFADKPLFSVQAVSPACQYFRENHVDLMFFVVVCLFVWLLFLLLLLLLCVCGVCVCVCVCVACLFCCCWLVGCFCCFCFVLFFVCLFVCVCVCCCFFVCFFIVWNCLVSRNSMVLLARPSCTNESLYYGIRCLRYITASDAYVILRHQMLTLYYGIRCLATQISDTGKTAHFSENARVFRVPGSRVYWQMLKLFILTSGTTGFELLSYTTFCGYLSIKQNLN